MSEEVARHRIDLWIEQARSALPPNWRPVWDDIVVTVRNLPGAVRNLPGADDTPAGVLADLDYAYTLLIACIPPAPVERRRRPFPWPRHRR